jgi:sulfopyruvate decarboxylase alpha subunit
MRVGARTETEAAMHDIAIKEKPGANQPGGGQDWPVEIYKTLKQFGVSQVSYVPDAGHSRLIELSHGDAAIQTTVLTTEEEGVALSAGAWLGGQRAALLMQSSGVGNCINMLSLMASCRFPLLTLVTMRGEWAEFNPWQIPMGKATPQAFEIMGVTVLRLEQPEDVEEVVSAACSLAFEGDQQIAILISQRMLGRKKWTENK